MSLKRFSGCLAWGFGCGRVNRSQIATVLLRFCRVVFWAVVVLVQSAQGAP